MNLGRSPIGKENIPALPAELKVLHVLDHSLPLHSGYALRSRAIFREQQRFNWKLTLLTSPKHALRGPLQEEVDGFTFYRTSPIRNTGNSLSVVRELAFALAMARRIEELAAFGLPHILHAHSPVTNALACLWAARRLFLPVVYEVRAFWEDAAVSHGTARKGGLRYRTSRAAETFAFRRSDAILAICDGIRQDILRRGISTEKVTLIPNGVDLTEFSIHNVKDQTLCTSHRLGGKVVLGFLGSFYPYEGLDILLSAMPSILKAQPRVVLLLVGAGPAKEALTHQARQLGISDSVHFVGHVPYAAVPRYYSIIDLFVYPRRSIRLTETVTPLKPLEAMAQGGVVLASDVGGHRELLRDGETGYLFKANDSDALSISVLQMLGRRDEWCDVGRRARAFVEAERGWARCAAGYKSAYARALADYMWRESVA